jgi:hypothetical protein
MKAIKYLQPSQLEELAKMQDTLNSMTCMGNFGHADWKKEGWDWGLAVIDEVLEIHGHLGWKWWKGSDHYKQGINIDNKKQIQLEVIDILHFGLSKSMQAGQKFEPTSQLPPVWDLDDALSELLVNSEQTSFSWYAFDALCKALDLTASEIIDIYTGKYALNIFRQDCGYGEGTYQKQWLIPEISIKYQEDNWYLEKILGDIKRLGDKVTVSKVTCELAKHYKLATGGGSK